MVDPELEVCTTGWSGEPKKIIYKIGRGFAHEHAKRKRSRSGWRQSIRFPRVRVASNSLVHGLEPRNLLGQTCRLFPRNWFDGSLVQIWYNYWQYHFNSTPTRPSLQHEHPCRFSLGKREIVRQCSANPMSARDETRQLEVLVLARGCRFKSCPRHWWNLRTRGDCPESFFCHRCRSRALFGACR